MLQPFQQKSGQGVVIIGFRQIEFQLAVELENLQIPCSQPGPGPIPLRLQLRLVLVVLQLISDDFAGEIRRGNQTLGATVFIHHQQERLTAADHWQQLRQGAGFQNPHCGLQVRLQRRISRQLPASDGFGHAPQVEHSSHIIQ